MPVEGLHEDFPKRDAFQHLRGDHPGAQAIIQVVGGIGQFIGHIADLGLEVAAQFGVKGAGIGNIVFRFVLDHALAHFPGQVQAGEFRVALFEFGDDAQGLFVVVKAAEILHQFRQGVFAGVTEGRMTQVVRQADGFHQVFVGTQGAGNGAADLGHFQRVGQAGAEVIAFKIDEDLGLVFQPAEGSGMQHPVAVALEGRSGNPVRYPDRRGLSNPCCACHTAPGCDLRFLQVLDGYTIFILPK